MNAVDLILPPARVDFDNDVETKREDADENYGGWYCVRTASFPCPASGCSFVAQFMTAAHLVIVWPRIDDPALLAAAANAQAVDRNPRVEGYRQSFGKAISWDEWTRLGRPIHGRMERPNGWEDRPWKL